ncbi:hypothetical protein HLK59_46350 [Streptomyces sp. S3(2020)]|uniref:hypothetical protein n=1 Tax=Streptomyces sp. S3(2020) TaxID=2732044 RepID=UPI00148A0189|nr:hypothetical protein [Streptomyces sp. S3(2020)]NNN37624.1 hypothetical protein [Streptomyces sp. S3(2020)]
MNTAVLKRRWPTLAALAIWAAQAVAGASDTLDDSVSGFGEVLPLLPLLYVVINQIGTPRATWPVLGGGLVLVFGLQALDLVSPAGAMVGIALGVLLWGLVRGAPHPPAVQAVGVAVFGALAVTGLAVDPEAGRWLVAAGWFLHGMWDLAHLTLERLRGTVAPTFAEWCAVVDVLVGVELLILR